jgi:hypothetical protein
MIQSEPTTTQTFTVLSGGYACDDNISFGAISLWTLVLILSEFWKIEIQRTIITIFSWNDDKKESVEITAMANLQLNPGESLIGQGLVSYRDLEKHTYQCWHATIYVTNQRVFLDTYTGIELKRSKIRGFTFGRILLFFPSVTIIGRAEKTAMGEHGLTEDAYTFTGFPIKKLKGWLQQAGIQEL